MSNECCERDCKLHKYHCGYCFNALTYSRANYALTPGDITFPCENPNCPSLQPPPSSEVGGEELTPESLSNELPGIVQEWSKKMDSLTPNPVDITPTNMNKSTDSVDVSSQGECEHHFCLSGNPYRCCKCDKVFPPTHPEATEWDAAEKLAGIVTDIDTHREGGWSRKLEDSIRSFLASEREEAAREAVEEVTAWYKTQEYHFESSKGTTVIDNDDIEKLIHSITKHGL